MTTTVSREENIITQVQTILIAQLVTPAGSYFKKIYMGYRETTVQEGFPCVYLEPVQTEEVFKSGPDQFMIYFDILIRTEMLMMGDFDNQILGNVGTSNKGIIRLTNDVKTVLQAYPNLNATCHKYNFPLTIYGRMPAATYPFRFSEITMRVQTSTTGAQR